MIFILDTTRETENSTEQLRLHEFIKFNVDKSNWYWLLVNWPVAISSKVIGSIDVWVKKLITCRCEHFKQNLHYTVIKLLINTL